MNKLERNLATPPPQSFFRVHCDRAQVKASKPVAPSEERSTDAKMSAALPGSLDRLSCILQDAKKHLR